MSRAVQAGTCHIAPDVLDTGRPFRHVVSCPYCITPFDLFAAQWCPHEGEQRSKLCPRCARCVCDLPAYRDERSWVDAPAAFRRRGFGRLFIGYI